MASPVEQIKQNLDIYSIVSEYVILKNKGSRFWGLCPFHQEKSPSFTVSPDKGIFHCFGCGKSGDIFTFIQEYEHLSFREALEWLASKAGVALETSISYDKNGKKETEVLAELYKKLAGSFQHLLLENEEGKEALIYAKKRGFSQKMIEDYKLGYAPKSLNWLYDFLHSKNFSDEFLLKSGFFSKNRFPYPLFSQRLLFPIINVSGSPIAFSGRALREDQQPKYINSPETTLYQKRSMLYGLEQASKIMRSEKTVYLCEGNFDVIALAEAGFQNTVAPLGTSFTLEQAKYLKRYVETVVIVFDGDDAGTAASLKAASILENLDLTCYITAVNAKEDPASLLEEYGVESIRKLLSEKKMFCYDFVLHHYIRKLGKNSVEKRQKVYNEVGKYIENLHSSVKKDIYWKELKKVLDISLDTKQNSKGKVVNSHENIRQVKLSELSITMNDELYMVIAALVNSTFLSIILKEVSIDELSDFNAIAIFHNLKERFQKNESSWDVGNFISELTLSEEFKRFLYHKISTEEFDTIDEKFILQCIEKIKYNNLLTEKYNLTTMISESERRNDKAMMGRYLKKQMDIETLLKDYFK